MGDEFITAIVYLTVVLTAVALLKIFVKEEG